MTSSATSPPVHAALSALRERFRASATSTLHAFERTAEQLAAAPDAADLLAALRRELHRVHGTAGSYGYMEASRLAARLEERVLRWTREPELDRAERGSIVHHFVGALRLAFDADDQGAPEPPARRRVVLVGLHGRLVTALRLEGMLHGWGIDVLVPQECVAARLRDLAPHVLITTTALVPRLRGDVSASGVPIVALDDRHVARPRLVGDDGSAAAGQSAGHAAASDPGVTVLDADVDTATLVELVERLTVRSTNAGATIVVVDDDPSVLAMVRYVVEADGTRVVTLADPSRLDATLQEVQPSLLLMDVQMHEHNGIALLRALRSREGGRTLPIVLFSTEVQADVRQRAYEAGADEFIPKPIVPAELRARIRSRLERQRLQRLAEGLHPGTGLTLPLRTERAAQGWLAESTPERRRAALALVRPCGGGAGEGEGAAAWLREAQRLAASMTGGVTGLFDGIGLLVLLPQDAASLAERLTILAAGSGEVRWQAGVAGVDEVRSRELSVLCAAATEARDLAADPTGRRVMTWSRDTADIAPDIVIVEDDPALADMLQFALRSAGYSFRTFRTGTEALDGLRRMKTFGRRPLVFLDIDLPGMDGHSLHERLCAERPGAFAIVFATGHGADGEQIRALRSGALDWVVKPLSMRVLMAKIPIWLGYAGRG